jgi:hypothetical protein
MDSRQARSLLVLLPFSPTWAYLAMAQVPTVRGGCHSSRLADPKARRGVVRKGPAKNFSFIGMSRFSHERRVTG